ncbi:MAG: hypothetical protein M0037_09705 [Betaproteobacteria bacterium]|nr:hypothetical protein [Betaproteobacteria bacterium]
MSDGGLWIVIILVVFAWVWFGGTTTTSSDSPEERRARMMRDRLRSTDEVMARRARGELSDDEALTILQRLYGARGGARRPPGEDEPRDRR